MNRPTRRFDSGLGLALLLIACAAPAVNADALRERILDSKYPIGDYAFYVGWHDPADWQFDEHGSYALPIGVKVRLRALSWLRVETDVSYFRRSRDLDVRVSVFQGPEFDSFSVGATVQWVPIQSGPVRPYLGGGPIFVSLGNDFVVFRPDVYALTPMNTDQFTLASWSKIDLGTQIVAGLDFPLGSRAFPFVEFRQLFGEVQFGARDVSLGTLSAEAIGLEISDLQTVPDDPAVGGRPHEGKFDWSGPAISVGLKIRF